MLGDQKCILRSVIDIFFRHLLIIIVTQFPYQEVRENTHIILHKKVYIYTHLYMYVCMYTYMHTYIHIHIYIYIHAYTYPYAYTCMCIYTCIYIHIHTYVYMYIHVCVCACVYTYIYIYISVQFSCLVISDYLLPHKLQHARLPCILPTPRVYPNLCPLSQ